MPAKTRSGKTGVTKERPIEILGGNCHSGRDTDLDGQLDSNDSPTGVLENRWRGHTDYIVSGTFRATNEAQAEAYIENCRRYEVAVDPGIVIALRTGWSRLQPSRHIFSEGSLLPLLGVLDDNTSISHLNLSYSVANITSSRGNGNGNSNARALSFILSRNKTIKELNLSNSGLDDVGLDEISAALKDNKFLEKIDLSGNYFHSTDSLSDALHTNSTITHIDISRNALSYQALSTLLCACNAPHPALMADKDGMISLRKLEVMIEGNYAFEEILNSTSHGVAFLFSVLGSIILMSEAMANTGAVGGGGGGSDSVRFWACAVYSASLMFLFLCSSLYHSFFMLPMASRVLQVLDHVGIYMLIAGSYTPYLLIGMRGHLSCTVLLVLEWLAVFCGILFSAQADFSSNTTTAIELVTFVAMGCAVGFVWPLMSVTLPATAITLLLAGGAAYIVGIFFFIRGESRPIYHSVWHLFVMLGAALHWFDVYLFIVNTRLGDVLQHCLLDLSDTIAAGEAGGEGVHSDHAAYLLQQCMEGLNNESAHYEQ